MRVVLCVGKNIPKQAEMKEEKESGQQDSSFSASWL